MYVKVVLGIPTLNAGGWVDRQVSAIAGQTRWPDRVVVVDSGSTDGAVERFRRLNAEIVRIPRADFDHGATRNLVFARYPADVYLFLTQDAVPADDVAFEQLLDGVVTADRVAIAYGRQLPHPGAGVFACSHRSFNYPAEPEQRTKVDRATSGVRTAFASNSFVAYRRAAIDELGGFPSPIVHSEDRFLAARALAADWEIRYVPSARVYHSHDATLRDDFARYFDVGAFDATYPWFRRSLGSAEREGVRFVRSQLAAIRAQRVPLATARVLARSAVRLAGYRIGRSFVVVPPAFRSKLSSNPGYWHRSVP